MADQTATFALRIDADAEPAKESAAALERFRSAVQRSQENVAAYRKHLAMLKGSSTEVADAKTKLKAAIEAEKAAITTNSLAILKLGGSYDKLQKAHKRENDTMSAGKKAIQAVGGPIRDVSEKLETMKGVLGSVSSGWGVLVVAIVAGTAAFAAAIAGASALISKFTEWLVVSGDALRNMQLMREAQSGNAKNATAWGHQIDWLSLKLATSKDKLNELVLGIEKAFRGTRVSGTGMVESFKAVATASAAMGDDVGRSIQGILERGKLSGRFGLNFLAPGISELQGTGITFQEVAKQLAKNLNIGLDQASAALYSHTVRLDAGAKAIRDVIEKRFGEVNEKKLVSLEGLTTKLRDNVRDWASDFAAPGGALEPLLKMMKSFVDLTGLQTESGQKMKRVVTDYATSLAAGIERNLPLFKELVLRAIDLGAWLIKAGTAAVKFATSKTGLFLIKTAFVSIGIVIGAITALFTPLIAFVGITAAGVAGLAATFVALYDGIKAALDVDWKGLGESIVSGIQAGLVGAWEGLKSAVGRMAEGVKNAFKNLLGIHSPSAVFAMYGKQTVAGYAGGVRSEASGARQAVGEMVATASPRAASGAAAGGTPMSPTVNVVFNISGGDAQRTAQTLQSPSVLDAITHAVQTALRSQAIPTGAPSMAGG